MNERVLILKAFVVGFLVFLSAVCILTAESAYSQSSSGVRFAEKSLWIQLGNQLKDVDSEMLQKIVDCGFNKIILLHSSINEQGYFPVLKSIVRKCHKRGIKVSLGTLVFKDTYQKSYWERYPELRKCDQNGKHSENKYYHYQICPNNPRNHEYIAGFLLRKAQESRADEIHIDYECTACYCPYCVEDFKNQYEKDARSVEPTDKDWLVWRSRKTRDFFAVLAGKVYASHPGFLISATAPVIGLPGGFTAYGIDLRYEDLTMYVDEFVPMIYLSNSQDADLAGRKYKAISRRVLDKYVVPGLIVNEEGTLNIKTGSRVTAEIESVYKAGAKGLGIFEVRYINDEIKNILKNM